MTDRGGSAGPRVRRGPQSYSLAVAMQQKTNLWSVLKRDTHEIKYNEVAARAARVSVEALPTCVKRQGW